MEKVWRFWFAEKNFQCFHGQVSTNCFILNFSKKLCATSFFVKFFVFVYNSFYVFTCLNINYELCVVFFITKYLFCKSEMNFEHIFSPTHIFELHVNAPWKNCWNSSRLFFFLWFSELFFKNVKISQGFFIAQMEFYNFFLCSTSLWLILFYIWHIFLCYMFSFF